MTRTLLLGLDGATFTLLDPAMKQGVMPFLKQFVENGFRASLRSTPCPVTPPAWTSMVTGRSPGHHGIFDFLAVDVSNDNHLTARLTNARDIKCEALWSFIGRHGKMAGILNFPATYLCPPFNGYLVPGFVTSRVLRTSVQPREFWERIKRLSGVNIKDISWDHAGGLEPLQSERMDFESLTTWIDYLKRKEQGWYAITRELIEETPCELIAVVFEGVDRLQHMMWDLLDPEYFPQNPTAEELEIRDYSYSYYRQLDGLIQQLVEAAGPNARIIIASDHGFGSTTEIFYVNAWLEKQGYLHWKEAANHDTKGELTTTNLLGYYETIDWQRTVAYACTTTSNGIYLRIAKTPDQFGIPPEKYRAVRSEIVAKLLSYKDPKTDTPVVTKVVAREEAFPGKAMEQAPDLTLTLRDGGFVSILGSEQIVRPRPEVKGTHRPEGIFLAAGKNIRQGLQLAELSILDVAPTLLYSMDLPIPENFEGKMVEAAFAPDYLASHPIRFCEATQDSPETMGSGGSDDSMKESDENVVLERLKALGYMQ